MSMFKYPLSFISKRFAEPKGEIISVIRLHGSISPASSITGRDGQIISHDKAKAWADLAFAVKGVKAVALSITCPGAYYLSLSEQ